MEIMKGGITLSSHPEQSILDDIKKQLGYDADYTPFDPDITALINSAMMKLHQLGVGPDEGFYITDSEQTWNDLFPRVRMLEAVRTYIYLSVKLVFDPPVSSFVLAAMERQLAEYESRIKEQARFFDPETGKYVSRVSAEETNNDVEQLSMFNIIDCRSGES